MYVCEREREREREREKREERERKRERERERECVCVCVRVHVYICGGCILEDVSFPNFPHVLISQFTVQPEQGTSYPGLRYLSLLGDNSRLSDLVQTN